MHQGLREHADAGEVTGGGVIGNVVGEVARHIGHWRFLAYSVVSCGVFTHWASSRILILPWLDNFFLLKLFLQILLIKLDLIWRQQIGLLLAIFTFSYSCLQL